jgi:DNA polymerase (family X)
VALRADRYAPIRLYHPPTTNPPSAHYTSLPMPTTNQKLAGLFEEMAALTDILGGDVFRVNGLKKVARVLDDLQADVATISADPKKLVAEVEGIGKHSAERIAEFLKTGKIKDHDDLLAQVPPGLPALLGVPGLGPKTVAVLWKSGGVTSLEDLKKKVEGDELAHLPGLGLKKLENLRKNLAFAATAGERHLIGHVMPLGRYFVDQLSRLPGVKRAEFAGSLRRGKETIADADVLVGCDSAHAAAVADAFTTASPVS